MLESQSRADKNIATITVTFLFTILCTVLTTRTKYSTLILMCIGELVLMTRYFYCVEICVLLPRRWTTEQELFIVEAYFRLKSIHAAQLQFKEQFRCREFPVHSMIYRWVNKFRTHGTITSIVKTLTDNHTLDDRNHQGHHTTLLLSGTVVHSPSKSVCRRSQSLESTGRPCWEFWSQVSTCILAGYRLNKSLHLMTWGSKWSWASGFATRLMLCQTFLTMSGFQMRHIFCCQVTWTLRTTSSGVAHPLSTVCKGHYTLWSALPGLPFPNMASLDHSGSRTTTSTVTIKTERYVQVLGKFWTALGQRRGVFRVLQWFQQDGATPTPKTNHWHGYSSVPLTDWSAADVTRSGRRIHQTWTPQIFICGDTLRTGYMATTPRLSLTWRQQSQQQ